MDLLRRFGHGNRATDVQVTQLCSGKSETTTLASKNVDVSSGLTCDYRLADATPRSEREKTRLSHHLSQLKQVVTRQSHRNDHLVFSYTDPDPLSMVREVTLRSIGEREQTSNPQMTFQPVLRTPIVQIGHLYQMSKKDGSFKVLHNLAADLCYAE